MVRFYKDEVLASDCKRTDANSAFYTHRVSDDPYYYQALGKDAFPYTGIALFNQLTQKNSGVTKNYNEAGVAQSNTATTYERDTKYQITDFSLQGYLSANHVKTADGSDDYASPNNGSWFGNYFSTAGIVSNADSSAYLLNISRITLKSLHIKSSYMAGGLIAHIRI